MTHTIETMLKTRDVTKLLQCDKSVVLRLVKSGRLKYVDIGGNKKRLLRFRPSDVEAFLAGEAVEPPPTFTPSITDADDKPINAADRIAIENLKKHGLT